MSFFYDLNKKLDSIRATPEVTHQQLNERDMGKHNNATTGFKALAAKTNDKIAGAQFQKMKKAGQLEEEGFPRIQAGIQKYTQPGIEKLAKLGREGASKAKMDATRKKYNQYDNEEVNEMWGDPYHDDAKVDAINAANPPKTSGTGMKPAIPVKHHTYDRKDVASNISGKDSAAYDYRGQVEEGPMDAVKKIGKKVAGGINKLVGHGSDEEMRKDLQRKSGAPMTDKQKSFAKLAPPTDKITFADKIAGAKKEVDEMLGQVAADAMRSAVGKSSEQRAQQQDDDFVNDHYAKARNNRRVDAEDQWARSKGRNPGAEMDEERSKGTAFDMSTPRAAKPKVGSIERGHKHDIKHTATGRMVTRRVDDQGNSVGADDDSDTQAGPRGRGRPKGTTGAIGAKGPSGRSKLMTKEGADQGQAQQVVDDLAELRAIAKQSQRGGQFPQGFASQLEVVLYAAITLIRNQQSGDAQVREEEKTSTRDDHAEKAGKKVAKDIEYDEKKKDNIHGKKRGPEDAKAEKAGKKVAKDIEHDEKKEEEVDESTTAGSVATSTATKSSKGSMVGKGIYDSMNRELENMIAESMTINMSNSTEGGKSLTITATDEDALKLGMLLKNAGLGGGDAHGGDMHSHDEQPCATCGMPDCGCGDVQEAVDDNAPDYPTNTEQADNNFGYAGGLNKPKTDVAGDGQTTVPVVAAHTQDEDALRRMMEMAGIDNNSQLSEGMMDKLKSMLVPKLMKMLGADAEKIASAVKQATGGDLTPSKENAMKVVQALGINDSAAQGQSPQMAEGIAGNWQGKLMQALYTLGLLGSAGAAASMWGTVGGSSMAVIGTLLLMMAGAAYGNEPGQVGAMGNFGNKGTSTQTGRDIHGVSVTNPNVKEDDDLSRMMEMAGFAEAAKPDFLDLDKDGNKKESMKDAADDKEEDTVEESIRRMMEIAGVKKKPMDEQKTEEGNKFAFNVLKAKEAGKKEADLDGDGDMEKVRESIFALDNQWQAYKG